MKQETTLLPNAHRFAGFAVLKSANIPSVLLELGYLSNPREDKLLQKKSYRRKLARALVRAVDLYFQDQTN
jgi:N-acetylmuramoyl-L-alanine amidase